MPQGRIEAATALLRQGVAAAAAATDRGAAFTRTRVAASVVSTAGGACALLMRRYLEDKTTNGREGRARPSSPSI